MKNVIISSIYILLTFLSLSCSKNNLQIISLIEETPINAIDYPNESIMSFPWSIDVVNDKILTFFTRGEYFIKVYDANNGM